MALSSVSHTPCSNVKHDIPDYHSVELASLIRISCQKFNKVFMLMFFMIVSTSSSLGIFVFCSSDNHNATGALDSTIVLGGVIPPDQSIFGDLIFGGLIPPYQSTLGGSIPPLQSNARHTRRMTEADDLAGAKKRSHIPRP